MADKRDSANVRFFPPGIPVLALLLGAALQTLWPFSIGAGLPASVRFWVGGGIVLLSVLLLGAWSVLLFRSSGQSADPRKPTTHIERRGPYRFTRNPMYLQMVLVCVGVGIASANGWILLLSPMVGWALQKLAIEPEESYLERKFGDSYAAYKRKVRRWL